MTINIFILKGDLNGKIVVVRFFFFVAYRPTLVQVKVTFGSHTATHIASRSFYNLNTFIAKIFTAMGLGHKF